MTITQSKKYPWVVVALLWFVAMLNYMDRQMLSTMRPAMQQDIAELQSATHFGYLMAIFLWIYGFMSPAAGMVADRINRKWLITGSLLVWSAVTLAMGYAHTFEQLYVLRALMGVSEALYIPAALSLIADYHHARTRSLAVAIHMTGLYMGQALGGFGATIAHRFSWQAAFQGFGLVGIVYALLLVWLLREAPTRVLAQQQARQNNTKRAPIFKGVTLLFSNIAFWVILFYFAAPSLPGWGVKNWLPTLFAETLQMDMSLAGPLSTITIAASSLIGVLAGGLLSDRWVRHHIKGRIYTSAIGLALTLPALVLIGYGTTLAPVLGAACCFGIGFGMFDANNMPILCQFVAPPYRATAYGIMNMTGVFAGALVTHLLGKSTDAGHLGQDFALLSAIVLVALLLQLWVLKPREVED